LEMKDSINISERLSIQTKVQGTSFGIRK